MLLALKSRFVGNVYVIECVGRIVLGEEVKALEKALEARVIGQFSDDQVFVTRRQADPDTTRCQTSSIHDAITSSSICGPSTRTS